LLESPFMFSADSRYKGALRLVAVLMPSIVVVACGQNGGGPPPKATPTPAVETFPVAGVVYLDDNGDGQREPDDESVIVPGAEVEIGGMVGTTDANGAFSFAAPRGTFPVNFRKLPPFFKAGATQTITVPQAAGGTPLVPTILPIGGNNLSLYLSSGDSISEGYGSSEYGQSGHDGWGYRRRLMTKLRASFGRASTEYRGGGGGTSALGAGRIERDLKLVKPAFTLVDWGVNDYTEPSFDCGDATSPHCPTIPNLRSILELVKSYESLPCVATLTPPNVGFDGTATPARKAWVDTMNDQIRTLAKQEGALLVDVGAAFEKQAVPSLLFSDHIHPNDDGYELMAATFADALLHGTVGATSADAPTAPSLDFER
jgi:lysophospholipase L1-like esterase